MSAHHSEEDSFELALRALRDEEGTDEQACALEQRLLKQLGHEALVAPLKPAAPGLDRVWMALGVSLLIGIGALLGGSQPASRPRDEPFATAHAPSAAAPQALVQAPPIASTVIAQREEAPSAEPVRTLKPRSKRPGARRSMGPQALAPSAAQRATKPLLESELSLLQRSRAALHSDPAAALMLTEQHARDYPAGMFVQERAVLAIDALLRQRRTAEAIARADRFLAELPSSAYAPRIRAMLAAKPRGAQANAAEPSGATP